MLSLIDRISKNTPTFAAPSSQAVQLTNPVTIQRRGHTRQLGSSTVCWLACLLSTRCGYLRVSVCCIELYGGIQFEQARPASQGPSESTSFRSNAAATA